MGQWQPLSSKTEQASGTCGITWMASDCLLSGFKAPRISSSDSVVTCESTFLNTSLRMAARNNPKFSVQLQLGNGD